MAASVSRHFQDEEANFTRLYQLIVREGTRVLRKAFDGKQPSLSLKRELDLKRLKLEKVLGKDQRERLFPASGEPSYDDFDITLLFVLLKNGVGNLSQFNPPPKGWDKMPDETDKSQEANFVRIKCYRNKLSHIPSAKIETNDFELLWKNVSEAIIALGADENEIENLKTKSVPKRNVTTELPSHIPNFIGNEDNINRIVEYLGDSKTNAVLLTGGPGYGKTTVAIKAAHEIAKETAVKFCPMRKYANTFTDLLRQISFVCTGELQKQIEDDPVTAKRSLLKWCKDLGTHFVLLLDDIEEALEQHREEVTNLLGEMTTSSNRQIKFILTSRTELASTTVFSVVKVHIQPLSTDHSVELIKHSYKNSQSVDRAERECMNHANLKQVAKLCDCVPLALCIAGALLTDFKVDELIADLNDNAMEALDDTGSGKSVERTIATSFKSLDERRKLSLISLSVFRGAFDKKAAKALLGKKCEEALRFFKARSLLQSESDGKYLMHSLIQRFVQNISKQEYVLHYQETERKYFDYFLQLLWDNSKIFWSKNRCKESIELFNNDRIHTEHAVTSFSRLAQSSQVVNKIAAEEFQRIFRYVKMCVPPNLYELLLRSVLKIAEKNEDALLQVQVLCRLGNETRKKTVGEELKNIMERANKIRLENETKFESRTNKQIELCFWNIYIRYLKVKDVASQGSDTTSELDDAQKSLEITHSSHCETYGYETLASCQTLYELGIKLFRSDKLHDKAKEKLLKSLEINERYLGDHIFTFYLLNLLSDLELDRKNYKEALQYNQSAEQMLKNLNILNGKDSILLLRSKASCLMSLGECDEAKRTLQKATAIAEENFEGAHNTKLSLKAQEAILCMKMGQVEGAKKNAQEAIEIAERLGRNQWSLKDDIIAIAMGKRKKQEQ